MKKLLIASGTLVLLLALGLTAAIAWFSQDFHAALMQQIAQSGLAQEQEHRFQPGLLRARSEGRLQLAKSYCAGCDVLQYQGTVYHGLATLLQGQAGLASADYQLQWPQLPLQPALPPLHLQARQAWGHGFQPDWTALVSLAPSQHSLSTPQHQYQLQHAGLKGQLAPGQLQLSNPEFALARDEVDWLQLQHSQLQIAANQQLRLSASSDQLSIPVWQWQGEQLQLQYQQQGSSTQLDAQLKMTLDKGQLADSPHGQVNGELDIQNLNLDAALAFARELPRLFSPQTTGAARMLGLFSLYSVHGPGFFSTHPAFSLLAKAVPLHDGWLDMKIDLAVTAQTRRPPMHPVEWRQALQGSIDISAPHKQLAQGWHWAAPLLSYITGLPQNYQQMKQQGWVQPLADGRERLYIRLDPQTGPRPTP